MNHTHLLAASSVSLQQGFLLLLVALTGFAMIWSTQKKLRARANSPLDNPLTAARKRTESEIRQDCDLLMVELNEFARQMNAQIDTRTAKLEALIRQADERLNALRQASTVNSTSGRIPTEVSNHRGKPGLGHHSENPLAAGDGSSLHRRVIALASEGLSSQQIAAQLRITPSEVELVLALRKAAERSNQANEIAPSRG